MAQAAPQRQHARREYVVIPLLGGYVQVVSREIGVSLEGPRLRSLVRGAMPSTSSKRPGAIVFLAGLVGACSSFGAAPTSATDAGAAPPVAVPDADGPVIDGGPHGGDADASRPCEGRTDLLLCEGFDSGDFAARGWTLDDPGAASIAVVTDRARSGGALRADVPASVTDQGAFWTRAVTGWRDIHLRVFAFIEAALPDPLTYPILLFSELELDIHLGVLTLNQYGQPPVFEKAPTPFPKGKWACIEWKVSATESVVSLDGTEVIRAAAAFIDPKKITVGLEYNETTTAPAAIWFDDLAVGTAPIGCD